MRHGAGLEHTPDMGERKLVVVGNCVLSGVAELGQGFFTQKAGDLEGFEGRKLVSEVLCLTLRRLYTLWRSWYKL